MNILLYLKDSIMIYKLPNEISGSYSFHAMENDSALINVDSLDNNWVLYQNNDVKILNGQSYIDKIALKPDTFYVLEKDKEKFLIYVEDRAINNIIGYKFDFSNELTISNIDGSNIKYNCPIFKSLNLVFSKRADNLYLKKDANNVYKNNKLISEPEFLVNNGDEIEIYGLRINIINNMIFINNNSRLSSNLEIYHSPDLSEFEQLEVKDIPLYKKEDYYNKSPRIRRQIEDVVMKIDKPPAKNDSQELPILLTIGSMITMGATSSLTLINVLMQLSNGTTTIGACWPQLVTCGAMMLSMFVWPTITKHYNKKMKEENEYQLSLKFAKYFDDKKRELNEISQSQSIILNENLINIEECIKNIDNRQVGFWDKRIDQDDFLEVRLGMGRQKLRCSIEYPEEGFTIDDNELKKRTDELVEYFQYIDNVPVSYSFKNNVLTAIMGNRNNQINFLNNIILQLISFYTYDDLKLVVITKEDNKGDFEYIKYLNHNFTNNKDFRYFAYDNESIKDVCNNLSSVVNVRSNTESKSSLKPHYFVIIDNYESVKHYDLINTISESETDLGFSIVFLENSMSNLPSKCNNFITLGDKKSDILINAFDNQEQYSFNNEIHYNIDMMKLAKKLSNIPIELDDEEASLPDAITFLEMERVGKVEQLNILNRWLSNDPTRSLRTEVGVDASGNLMYLDLHEKFHGPHGLIAGMTGSGKSEFIITYILSMAMNYSPNDVAFILIDYKGGGLAGAFENKNTGVRLPHLAGTITNLDKAEMDRTLVSINSELERRQKLFNEARDSLGESTMDIYKYQSCFRDGKLTEAIPHLFIICDEFAELKSQQADFMDSLISTARIGRSLGVHLILATQKPSGVVNEQIWSNTKFRVCLKVQDANDSKEMLKKNDAALLKQTGRFYLQVGYDEYYALGQSAWCGAKYYPSDQYIKQVDKSINFIDSLGYKIKNISESSGPKVDAEGEQITSILKHIIEVAKKENIFARRLWLENIPEYIYIDALEEKYSFGSSDIEAVIGEYDAPELQVQGLAKYNYIDDGNTIVFGLDGGERELLLNSLIYSTTKRYKSDDVNYYIVDYGSESLRMYQGLPQIGGMVFQGEDEKFNNLLKLINQELSDRKKLFVNYGGDYKTYIQKSGEKLPLISVIFNNYDSISDNNKDLYEIIPDLVRDSERYGIVFIFTANTFNSVSTRISQNFNNFYAFHLNDKSDYTTIFNVRNNAVPRDINGRGLLKVDGALHEFQVAHIVDDDKLNDTISKFIEDQKQKNERYAKRIPVLPDIVRLEDVKQNNILYNNIPVGISKNDLEIINVDLSQAPGYIVTSNKLANTANFIKSFISENKHINNYLSIVFDPLSSLDLDKNTFKNYYTSNIKESFEMVMNYIKSLIEKKSTIKGNIIIYGLQKWLDSLEDVSKFEEFTNDLKKYENISLIIVDDVAKIKEHTFDQWFKNVLNVNNGIWIGRGIGDQTLLHVSSLKKEMLDDIKNDMGYVLNDGSAEFVKLIDFISTDEDEEEKI